MRTKLTFSSGGVSVISVMTPSVVVLVMLVLRDAVVALASFFCFPADGEKHSMKKLNKGEQNVL